MPPHKNDDGDADHLLMLTHTNAKTERERTQYIQQPYRGSNIHFPYKTVLQLFVLQKAAHFKGIIGSARVRVCGRLNAHAHIGHA